MKPFVHVGLTALATLGLLVLTASTRPLPAQAVWRNVPEMTQRIGHAMAADPVRKRVVLFGGAGLDDTWEWNGSTWQHFRPPISPSARYAHAMAFDPVRGTVILFGGWDGTQRLGDTWEWDGNTWRELFPPTAPQSRSTHTMATDFARGRVVMFGGQLGSGAIVDETWEWDGQDWRLRSPATTPGPRKFSAMAYHPASKAVALFGGGAWIPSPDQAVWLWDGVDWRAVNAPVAPTKRAGQAMAVHPSSGDLILYGGAADTGFVFDTWRWDGSQWHQVQAPQEPTRREEPQMASDYANGMVILLGSRGTSYAATRLPQRDTWAFDGATWHAVADFPLPMLGFNERQIIAHDPARGEFVLFGGLRNHASIGTWVLRGDEWVKLQPQNAPQWRERHRMRYHAGTQRVVLVGGGASSSQEFADTWLWDGSDWSPFVGSPQPPPRVEGMIYDSVRDKIVVIEFGSSRRFWEWDSNGWSIRPFTGGPASSYGIAFGFDPVRNRIVLFDGQGGDTWEWDGFAWQAIGPRTQPPARNYPHLEYVPGAGGLVMLGGITGSPAGEIHCPDTWAWDGTDWRQLVVNPLPSPRGGDHGALGSAYDSGRQRLLIVYSTAHGPRPSFWELTVENLRSPRPYLRLLDQLHLDLEFPHRAGDLFVLGLSHANRPGLPLRLVPGVGVELVPLAPGAMLNASLAAGLAGQLDVQGRATVGFQVPNDPYLRGFDFHAAAVTANSGGITSISNALELRIVR